jgi:UDP-glucose:(heptosyl)LPS alpha-1,3-glucosyltransferase
VVQGFGRTIRHHVYRAGGGVHEAWLAVRDRTLLRRWLSSLSPVDRLERWIDRQAFRRAGRVVCNSDMAARQVEALYGVPGERIRVVRNGIDGVRFHPDEARRALARERWGVPSGGRVAMFLGHGFRRKGLAVAGAAFARASGPGDRFVVVGRDAHARRHIDPLRALLGDRLVVTGGAARPEDCLPGADATVLPTWYDAAANTTVEALACGVPAVTSGRDGNAEIVPERGWIVEDPGDVGGFARALDAAWSADASARARCRAVAEAWPVSRNGLAMEEIYREWRDG